MEYAVIRTGGKQYRVAPGEIIRVEKLTADPGAEVEFGEVLMTSTEAGIQIGQPMVPGAKVTAQVMQQGKAKKILIFKKKRRKNYRRRQGHRQLFTELRVTRIEIGA
jgi:large subunit ribosomal protein L21